MKFNTLSWFRATLCVILIFTGALTITGRKWHVTPTSRAAVSQQTTALTKGWTVWETAPAIQRVSVANQTITATHSHGGISRWQSAIGVLPTTLEGHRGPDADVVAMAVDSVGNTWMADAQGNVRRIAVDGNVADMTPEALRGVKTWDFATHGNDVWLATLGAGVWQYTEGAWTSYTVANVGLPSDDVYAVAVTGDGTPWIGTLGQGVATRTGDTWTTYQLPTTIGDPTTGNLVTNDAVLDIAFDQASNTWFATDGSGLVKRDRTTSSGHASSSEWDENRVCEV